MQCLRSHLKRESEKDIEFYILWFIKTIMLFKDFISNMQKAAILTDLSLALKEKKKTLLHDFLTI